MSLRIFANHAHVFPAAVNSNATIERLLHLMDACGIEQAVCFAPFAQQMANHSIAPNDWLAKELAGRDRLIGFGTIDFSRDDFEQQVRHAADLGFRGLKLHPNTQRFDVLSRGAMEVYAAANERRMFLTIHTGVHHYRIEHYRVTKFDEIAYQFPDLKMSLEHVGGYHFFNEALAVIFNNIPFPPEPGRRGNVYGGLTSVFTPDYLRFWYMPPERFRELLMQVGAEYLIFGLDFPYNLEENIRTAIRTIEEIVPNEHQRALILGGNLREALGV